MKKTILSIFCIMFFPLLLMSQENNIVLNVVIPEQGDYLKEQAINRLKNKMQRLATNSGLGGEVTDPRFVLVPQVFVNEFSSVGGSPPRTLAKLEVVMKVSDAKTQKIFGTHSMQVAGVGTNNKAAFQNAIQKINSRDRSASDFLKNSKEKIVNYYKNNCSSILQEAKNKANQDKYKRALSILGSIPSEAESCYEKSSSRIEKYFKQYQEVNCDKDLQTAKSAYASGDKEKAAKYLSRIPSNTSCYKEAQDLFKKLSKERKKRYQKKQELKEQYIKAARDVAVAEAKNQPDVNVNYLVH